MSNYQGYEKYNAILSIFLIRFRPFIHNDRTVVIISHKKTKRSAFVSAKDSGKIIGDIIDSLPPPSFITD
ncbi:hypothetical protein QUA43_06980 [Microcoleus sp. N9_B4]